MQEALLEREEAFEVWPENWPAVELFLAVQTQWKVGALGGLFGLDYAGVEVVFRMRKVANRAEMFAKLQVMEAAALAAMSKKKD